MRRTVQHGLLPRDTPGQTGCRATASLVLHPAYPGTVGCPDTRVWYGRQCSLRVPQVPSEGALC
eukprot:2483282-Rhodomonas_salina.2